MTNKDRLKLYNIKNFIIISYNIKLKSLKIKIYILQDFKEKIYINKLNFKLSSIFYYTISYYNTVNL